MREELAAKLLLVDEVDGVYIYKISGTEKCIGLSAGQIEYLDAVPETGPGMNSTMAIQFSKWLAGQCADKLITLAVDYRGPTGEASIRAPNGPGTVPGISPAAQPKRATGAPTGQAKPMASQAPQASPAPPPATSPTVKEQTNSASDLSAEFAEFGIDLEPGGGKRDNHPFESTTTQE